jgi:hypothetical protein
MDREGDVHEVIEEVLEHGEGCVIRSNQNRRVAAENDALGHAHDLVAESDLLGLCSVTVGRNGERAGRTARLEIRAIALQIRPASPHHKRRGLEIAMVEAREVNAPANVKEPIRWRLLTTESYASLHKACAVVAIYAHRWLIEELHMVLKSGCRIEATRMRTARRIQIMLAFYAPVAVFLLQLREWSRLEPEAPCTVVLEETIWPVLYAAVHGCPAPLTQPTPTIREAVMWIGRLGGHLGRKSDAMPGIRVLWRGWRDLSRFVALARALAR